MTPIQQNIYTLCLVYDIWTLGNYTSGEDFESFGNTFCKVLYEQGRVLNASLAVGLFLDLKPVGLRFNILIYYHLTKASTFIHIFIDA